MPTTRIELRVFVAAPSEVLIDKTHVRSVIDELNSIHGSRAEVILRYIAWETDVHPSVGLDAQSVINEQIGDHYDIFVGLMWSQFGNPTGRFGSGTEEEYNRALKRLKIDPQSVSLLFYFKDAPIPPSKIDIEQLSAVSRFKRELCTNGVLYDTYHSDDELRSKLRQHLAAVSREWLTRISPSKTAVSAPAFTPTQNSDPDGEESETDFGFLDYIEKGTRCFEACAAAANRIARCMNDRSQRVPAKAGKLEAAMKLPLDRRVSTARRILSSVASDMDAISVVLEKEAATIAQNFNAGLSTFEAASKLMATLESPDSSELINAANAAATLQETFVHSQESYTTLKATIVGLPDMERLTNRAKKRLSHAIENYIGILRGAEASLVSFCRSTASILADLESRQIQARNALPSVHELPST